MSKFGIIRGSRELSKEQNDWLFSAAQRALREAGLSMNRPFGAYRRKTPTGEGLQFSAPVNADGNVERVAWFFDGPADIDAEMAAEAAEATAAPESATEATEAATEVPF